MHIWPSVNIYTSPSLLPGARPPELVANLGLHVDAPSRTLMERVVNLVRVAGFLKICTSLT